MYVCACTCMCVCVYTGFPPSPIISFLTVQHVKDLSRLLIGEKTSKFSIFIIFQKARISTFYMEPAPWTRCFFKTVIHLAVSLKAAANWHSSLYLVLLFFLFILLSPAPPALLHRFEKRHFLAYNGACMYISRRSGSVRDWNRFAAGCLVNSFLNAQSRRDTLKMSVHRSRDLIHFIELLFHYLSIFMSLLFLFFFLVLFETQFWAAWPLPFCQHKPPLKVPPHYC